MKNSIIYRLTLLVFFFAASCAQRDVTRIDSDKQTDISGRWNDTDARLVTEKMTEDVLSRPWLGEFREKHGRKPVVIVGTIKNKTHEHIDPQVFIKDLEKEFINTGKVRVVQNKEFREKMREERADQQEFASQDTQKEWGKELGADFMLFGNISSVVDQYKDEKTVFYQVNLELANLETNELVWIGEKEIKKFIEN